MMTTREDLRTIIRLRLGDVAETPILSNDQLDQWINDSLREYSVHFPRLAELHIVCSASVREYTINGRTDESGVTIAGAKSILRVEYPTGMQPPQVLVQRSELDGRGFCGENVYDVRQSPELTLVLGAEPVSSQTIAIQLSCDYPSLTLDAAEISAPERHLELLILFPRLLALQELATTEAIDPSPTGVILSGLSTMLSRAREEYDTKLADYLRIQSPGSQATGWKRIRVY